MSSYLRVTLHLSNSLRQFTLKLLSGRLNIRPYNRLDKEVIDFREYKERLITLYDTKCFHYQNGKNEDGDKYKTYT